jgi:hypothetical protein
MKVGVFLAVAALAACSSSGDADEPTVTVGDVALAPPSGWQVKELGANTRVWTPATNPRKESITVIVGPSLIGNPSRALAATRTALGRLHDARVAAESAVTTTSGLTGERFDLTFRPDAAIDHRYGRSHVVLIVGDHPVHVIYTASTPDPDHVALDRALASIRKES